MGSCSHRFNLAVGDIIQQFAEEINTVHELMKKLKSLIPSARLRQFTPLCAVIKNDTRWSSCYNMISRFLEIKNYIEMVGEQDESIKVLIPSQEQMFNIQKLFKILQKLEPITKALQAEKCTLCTVRYIFDEVGADFPCTSHLLLSSAPIVQVQAFETAVVKLQHGWSRLLTEEEKSTVQKFKKLQQKGISQNHDSCIVSRACKRQKTDVLDHLAGYEDVRYIFPSSNICERLFSSAGIAMDSRRQRLLPSNLESQMFLFAYSSCWNIDDIALIQLEEE